EFLWNINNLNDPYINEHLVDLNESAKPIVMNRNIKGFIASVNKPRDLKIISTTERAGVDLFVNGRLRERDILKHIPTARVAENYFYGQIHFNKLDDNEDRFATGREGIVADDPKYKRFLNNLRKVILGILNDWDDWRIKHRQDGDSENKRKSRKERASLGLYNAVSEEYALPNDSENRKKVDSWVDDLGNDAKYNFASYAECFISENLIRKHIQEESISLSPQARRDIDNWKNRESQNKSSGNININLRQSDIDVSYLDMAGLANLVESSGRQNCLPNDAKQYRPIRDALMHTALLTDEAKRKLETVYDNIKGRIKALLSGNN
ncbi:hypothetical protein LCGC14_2578370, partial [marine sediment metagenome]